MKQWFGTDGVRGEANTKITAELALALAQASVVALTEKQTQAPLILIGMDPRRSGKMLEAALAAGFSAMGAEVQLLGVVPTPTVAWLVKETPAAMGVMISASHNPAPDNGLKFFSASGHKLPDKVELEIENLLTQPDIFSQRRRPGTGVGQIQAADPSLVERYCQHLRASVANVDLKNLHIGLDLAQGATASLAAQVFEPLGLQVDYLHAQPDGLNINQNCGSTDLASLKTHVQTNQLDLGLAFDGDGDRCLAVGPDGSEIDGDQMMYIISRYLPEFQSERRVVATVMSNLGFEQALAKLDKKLLRTQVGDRYVLETMQAEGIALGGEQSGHLIFSHHQVTGDGLLTALQFLRALVLSQRPLIELLAEVPRYPQLLKNIVISPEAHQTWQNNQILQQALTTAESELAQRGRILVRASGTEPKLRIMAEGQDQTEIENIVDHLVSVAQAALA